MNNHDRVKAVRQWLALKPDHKLNNFNNIHFTKNDKQYRYIFKTNVIRLEVKVRLENSYIWVKRKQYNVTHAYNELVRQNQIQECVI